jgi:hypothetical protein
LVVKASNLLWVIGGTLVFVLFIAFPGSLRDIPNWGWAIIGAAFVIACLAGMWREGELGTFAKRGSVALLFLVPLLALLTLLPGEEGGWDPPLLLVILLTVVPTAILLVIGLKTGFFESVGEMFARHPPACEHCQMMRKDLVWFETKGRIGSRPRLSLCPDCVWNGIQSQLETLRNRVLVAAPVRNAGGYYSLNVDGIAEWWDPVDGGATTERVLRATREISNEVAGRCEECNDVEANICWIPAQVFRGSWDKFSDLLADKPEKLLNNNSRRFLCGGCAAQMARQAAHRLRLHLVTAPSSDTLIMLPGEA